MQLCPNYSNPKSLEKLKTPEKIFHIKFCNFPVIFHNENIKAEPHKISVIFVTPTMVHEISNPIKSKIFNNCINNKYVTNFFSNVDVDHFLTGDLSIVENSRLCKLICKRPKFREKISIILHKAKKKNLKRRELLRFGIV